MLTLEDRLVFARLRNAYVAAYADTVLNVLHTSDRLDYNEMRGLMSAHPRDVRGGDLFRTPAQLLRERMESDDTAAAEAANDY